MPVTTAGDIPFRSLRAAHKTLTKVVRHQNRELEAAAEREQRMRIALHLAYEQHLPEPAALALLDVARRRQDLNLDAALGIVEIAFGSPDG